MALNGCLLPLQILFALLFLGLGSFFPVTTLGCSQFTRGREDGRIDCQKKKKRQV
jgi:hypothetical protein